MENPKCLKFINKLNDGSLVIYEGDYCVVYKNFKSTGSYEIGYSRDGDTLSMFPLLDKPIKW